MADLTTGLGKRRVLVTARDQPYLTEVAVAGGIPRSRRRRFAHDDPIPYTAGRHADISELHREALRKAAAHALRVAEQFKCRANVEY